MDISRNRTSYFEKPRHTSAIYQNHLTDMSIKRLKHEEEKIKRHDSLTPGSAMLAL